MHDNGVTTLENDNPSQDISWLFGACGRQSRSSNRVGWRTYQPASPRCSSQSVPMRSVSGPSPIAEPQPEARTILRYSDNRSRPSGKLRLQLRMERWPQHGDIYSGVFAATRKFRV